MASNLVFLLVVSVLLSFQPLCCSSRPLVDTPDFSSHLQYSELRFEPTETTKFVDHEFKGIKL
ncbi:hypothetical protein Mapa_017465 [Marchantia paleacea]|nr:hypothetical protein Mapa_017465 [Marchantia paleacea]